MGFFAFPTWILQLLYNLCSIGLFIGYLSIFDSSQYHKASYNDILTEMVIYNFISVFLVALVEKSRKESWVLFDTFKKSENIFRKIYEGMPSAIFIIDRNKRILYANNEGISLLSCYYRSTRSFNFFRTNVTLEAMLEEKSLHVFEEAQKVCEPDRYVNCYISLKVPDPDPGIDAEALKKIEKDNEWKVYISSTNWKNTPAYQVIIKNYTSKIKSEKVVSKAMSFLTYQLEDTMRRYEEYPVNKSNSSFQLSMITKMNKLKISLLNTMLMFSRIFNRNTGLSDVHNFNIQTLIKAIMGIYSVKARERKCDLFLKFEASFPSKVCGDEYLFHQIIGNTLQMILEKCEHGQVSLECIMRSVLQNGNFLLSFEFVFPKSSDTLYEHLKNKLQLESTMALDHLLENDEVSFFAALIHPALGVFGGKVFLGEIGDKLWIRLDIPFPGTDDTKPNSKTNFNTLEDNNFNVTKVINNYNFIWKAEEPEKVPDAQTPKVGLGTPNGLPTSVSGLQQYKKMRQQQEIEKNKKIREELKSLSRLEQKNFGGDMSAKQTTSPPKKEPEKAIIKMQQIPPEEEKPIQKPKALPPEFPSPSTNPRERAASFRYYEYDFKMAMSKALIELIDNFEQKEKANLDPKLVNTASALEMIDAAEKIKGGKLNEHELYNNVLTHLSDKIKDPKYSENFIRFVVDYSKQLEKDLFVLESSFDYDFPETGVSSAPILNQSFSSISMMSPYFRRSDSMGRDRIVSVSGTKKTEPTERRDSLEGKLKERIMPSPFVYNTIQFHRGDRQRPKQSMESILFGKLKKIDTQKKTPEQKKKSIDVAEGDLPPPLQARKLTQRRKWFKKATEPQNEIPERSFHYEETFTILIIDDSDFIFRAIESLPTRYERNLDFAKNGMEAFKKYLHRINQGLLYHLILCDLQMPVMDGFETVRNIRAEEAEKNLPRTYVCAMSAFEDQETINKAKREGMDNFCQKPLRVEVLNNLIKTRCQEIGITPKERV